MAALGSLVANLVLQYAQYTQGLNAAQQQALGAAKKIQDGVDKISDSVRGGISSMAKSAAGAAAAYFSVQAGIQGVTSAIDRLDAVSDRMQKVGVGAEALQALSYYAEFSGTNIEGLDTSLRTLSKGMEGVRDGSKEQVALFKAMGVQVVDTNGKMRSTEDVFRDLAEKFSGYEDGASKTALAMKVFGKAGADMLPMLNSGAQGIDDATEKAKKFGLVMSGETVEGAAKFNDTMDDLGRVVQGTFNRFAESVLPLLTRFAELIVTGYTETAELGRKTGALGSDKSLPNWIEAVVLGLGAVADVAVLVGKLFDVITSGFKVAVANVNLAVATVVRAKSAISGVFGDGATDEDRAAFDGAVADAKNAVVGLGDSLKDVWQYDGSKWLNVARKAVQDVRSGVAEVAKEAEKPRKPPPIIPAGGGTTKVEALDYSKEIQAIEIAAKAESDAIARMVKENDAAYAAGLKSAFGYYDEKGALLTRGALATATAAEKELAVIQGQIASGKGTVAERKKLAEQEQKLTGDIAKAYLNLLGVQKDVDTERADYSTKLLRGWAADAEKTAEAAETQAQALRDQVNQYGMTKGAIADVVAMRAREDAAMARTGLAMAIMRGDRQEDIKAIMDEVAALDRRAEALAQAAGDTYEIDRLEKQEQFTEEAKRQNEQIGESLTDALMRGFEDGEGFASNFKTTLVNMFKTLVLKPIIQPLAQGAANYVTGALGLTGAGGAGTAAGGNSLMGTASNLSSLYSAFTGDSMIGKGLSAIGSYFGGGAAAATFASTTAAAAATQGIAGMVGSTAIANAGVAGTLGGLGTVGSITAPVVGGTLGGAAGGGLALSGGALVTGGTVGGAAGALGGGVVASAGAGAGAGAGAAAMIPYIGWAIAAAAVLSTFIGSDKTPAVGGNGLVNIKGSGTTAADEADAREKFFGDDRGYKGPNAGLSAGLGALGDQIAATAKLYGGNAEGLSIYGQTAQSPDGQGASGGTALYNKDGTQIFGSSFEGKNEELEANVALSMKRALLGGLKASDLAPEFAAVFKGYGENLGTLTEEQITSITESLEAVRSMNTMFDGLAITFPELEKLGWEARTAITGFSGGIEALTTNIGSYYETYYDESERMGETLASMTNVFQGLNLKVPSTKEQFKALVESLDLTTEAGQRSYATLLGMNQQFAGWADYTEAQAKAIADALKVDEDSYAKGYVTEAERNAEALALVREAFTGLGLAMPSTRAGFRALVESLDLTTEAGRKARATLLGVSDEFGAFADNIAAVATAVVTAARDAAETAATGAMSTLTRSVNVQKNKLADAWKLQQEAMQTGIDAASTALANHKALSDRVKSTLESMFGQTDATMQRRQAQAQISGALTTARSGGGLPDVTALESAMGIVAQPSQDLFATFEDYQLDFLKTANDIAALGELTDSQLSIEERTLATLKDQLKEAQSKYADDVEYYDQMLETAQAQLDAALGNTQATLTVAQALSALSASLASLGASKPNTPAGNGAPPGLSKDEQAVWDAYASSGIGYLDNTGWQFWNEAIKNGANPSDIAQQIIDINNGKSGVDGSHAAGLDYVPFDGYVAELHRGERVKTAAQARAEDQDVPAYAAPRLALSETGAGQGEVAVEIRAVRQEIQGLRFEAQAIAKHTARSAKTTTRWDAEGLPATREETTA